MPQLITLKGGRAGLRLQLDESAMWHDLLAALTAQLEQGAQFFNGAQAIVDVGERELDDVQLGELLTLMREHGLKPESLASTARASREAARSAGVTARPLLRSATENEERGSETLFHTRTVRSGQMIRHQGHVTIVGDVNAGGEVIAGGSVVIWGRVRGIVHAGALGDRTSIICALDLKPTQLRIADLIALEPGNQSDPVPEVARVEADRISVDEWNAARK